MGEEEKKPEEKKMEEKKPEEAKKPAEEKKEEKQKEGEKPATEEKKEEKKAEEGKDQAPAAPAPPPPPQEIVLKVYMHCEGCARKVRRCLKGFEGVEDVTTDCRTHKVVVKGDKADPLKVLERVERKTHRQVELLSPIPKPPAEEKKPEEKEKPKPEEKKEEVPVVTVVLMVYMHCEACAQKIKKCILRMKGVESAEPDLKSSQVTVKGALDPSKLVEYVYKRTGKQAVIVKQEPDKKDNKDEAKESKDEKKAGGGDKDKKGSDEAAPAATEAGKEEKKENKERENEGGGDKGGAVVEENKVVEFKKNGFNYYPPRYAMEMYAHNAYPQYAYNAYPPQIFSDENPNACSVM